VISSDHLRESLHVDEVDLEDLAEVLQWHFGGARYIRERELGFPQSGEAVLTLRFSSDGKRLETIIPGPGLDETAIAALEEKVRAELLESAGRRTGNAIVFTLEEVRGTWRFEDRLALRPVPDDAPRPTFSYADHPALLGFVYTGSSQAMIDLRRRERAAVRWTNRLNLLIRPGLELADNRSRHHWVLVPGEAGVMTSTYLQSGYWLPPTTVVSDPFTGDPGVPMSLIEPQAYYGRLGTTGDPLTLPTSLDDSITAIEALPPDALMRFDRAVYWFGYAINVASAHSGSAAAIALGAAVEALFEPSSQTPRCSKCGKELQGPTARFIDFMLEHLPGTDEQGARGRFGELYGLRSRPAHGHVMDRDLQPIAAFMPGSLEDDRKLRMLFDLVRTALINWLWRRVPNASSEVGTIATPSSADQQPGP
jgi:hypothetical protein